MRKLVRLPKPALVVISLALSMLLGLIISSPVQAIIINDENIPADPVVRGWDHVYTGECNAGPGSPTYGHRQIAWISKRDEPTSHNRVEVPFSQRHDPIELQLNIVTHFCRSIMNNEPPLGTPKTDPRWAAATVNDPSKLDFTRINVTRATADRGSLGGFPSNDHNVDILIPQNPTHLYQKAAGNMPWVIPFTLTLTGDDELTPGTNFVHIEAFIRPVNRFDGGALFHCVLPAPTSSRPARVALPRPGSSDRMEGINCDEDPAPIDLMINVNPDTAGPVNGRVYNFDTGRPYAGRRIDLCGVQVTTNSQGRFSANLPPHTGFCVRDVTGSLPSDASSGPFVLPSGAGYASGANGTGSCHAGGDPCAQTEYHWQVTQADCYLNAHCGTGPIGSDTRVRTHDRGTDSGYDIVYRSDGPPGGTCGTIERIDLPDLSPSNRGQPSGHSHWDDEHVERRKLNRTAVTEVKDISPGDNDSMDAIIVSYTEGYEWVELDYGDFGDAYPYDRNRAEVDYESYYEERVWTATGDAVERTRFVYDPDTDDDNDNGRQDPGEGHNETYIIGYEWEVSEDWDTKERKGTERGPMMQPCYKRTYNTDSTISGSAQLDPRPENPDEASFAGSFSVQFGVRSPARGTKSHFRTRTHVDYHYAVGWWIDRALSADSAESVISRSITVTAGNWNKTSSSGSGTISRPDIDVTAIDGQPGVFLRPGDRVCYRAYISNQNLSASEEQGIVDIDGSPTGSGRVSETFCTGAVVNQPYVSFYGGDVTAGGSFGTGSCHTPAGIRTFVTGSPSSYSGGSSTQFAALAIGVIEDFASASLRTSAPARPTGLSVANTAGGYGGSSNGAHCLRDYFNAQPGGLTPRTDGVVSITALATGREAYLFRPPAASGGTLNISGGSIPDGNQITLYVDGDAVINNDIVFANTAAWASRESIPTFHLIVRGSIYIHPRVERLDGVYIAQPSNPADGRIYTCATGTTPVAPQRIYQTCDTPLTVNGSFIAQKVNLLRAAQSSLRYSTPNERPAALGGTPHVCEDRVSRRVCAAEVFNFSPESYVGEPMLPVVRGPRTGKYDYITSLPPVL